MESVLLIKAHNDDADEPSTLFREITVRVLKKMDMKLSLNPKKLANQGESTILGIELPDNLPSSMFPLEFHIEDVNHTLYASGYDGDEKSIIVPVKTDKSIVDGVTNSFYFIRTVNESEYNANHTITTEFTANKDASATTIYVSNEYFETQSINLLNDGMYVNPEHLTVPFNTTSVKVEVEFAEPDGKSWTVTAGSDSGITSIKDEDGNVITGGTGNGKFFLHFPVNNTTASTTRTATVTYGGKAHTVTITQMPLEFSVSTETPDINYNVTTANVTVFAAEGQSWTASITGPDGTNPTLSAMSGEPSQTISGTGSQTLTVTVPANTGHTQRRFVVEATMDDEDLDITRSVTIVQHGVPVAMTFAASSFNMNTSAYTGSASSADLRVDLTAAQRSGTGNNAYITLGRSYWDWGTQVVRGSITVTPLNGMVITGITVNYSSATYGSYDTDYNPKVSVSSGSYSRDGETGTWTGSSTEAVTFTNGYRSNYGNYYFPRIQSIVVSYEAVN